MIARNKASMVSNHIVKDKKQNMFGRHSEDRSLDPDQVDFKSNGLALNGTNDAREHISNGHSADSDSLTIAHARSKSAPAINQAGVRLRQRKKGRIDDINNDDDEDEEIDDDDIDYGDDSDAEECYKKITEGRQHAQPEQPQRIRPEFAKNLNSDNKASNKERSKSGTHLTPFKNQVPNHYHSVEDIEDSRFTDKNGLNIKRNQKGNGHVYDVPEGEDYMAIYETIDRKRQEARELKNKSHSMEALETPNASIKGDDDQNSTFDFKEASENGFHLQKQPGSSTTSAARRRHRSKPHESNKASTKNTSNSFHNQEHKRWSIHEKSASPSVTSHSFQPQTSKKVLTNNIESGQNMPSNGSINTNNHHHIGRNNPPNVSPSTDLTDGGMASFLKRALRMEGPQLVQRTISIKKTVRESLGMRIGGGIGSNEGDTPIYIANIHPHGCIGKSKQLKVSNVWLESCSQEL